MSMCGEMENLAYEIKQKELELKSLQTRLSNLAEIVDRGRAGEYTDSGKKFLREG